jgi:hypothetical protein
MGDSSTFLWAEFEYELENFVLLTVFVGMDQNLTYSKL